MLPQTIDPVLEFGCLRDMKALEEGSAVERQGLLGPSLLHGRFEGGDVDLHPGRLESHLGAPATQDDVVSEPGSEEVEGLVQGVAGPLLRQLRPEGARRESRRWKPRGSARAR